MLCVVMEDTARVIGERQLAALNALRRAWAMRSPSRKCLPQSNSDSRTRKICRVRLSICFNGNAGLTLCADWDRR